MTEWNRAAFELTFNGEGNPFRRATLNINSVDRSEAFQTLETKKRSGHIHVDRVKRDLNLMSKTSETKCVLVSLQCLHWSKRCHQL